MGRCLKLCVKQNHKVYANSLQAAHRPTVANYQENSTYPKKKKTPFIPQGFSEGVLWAFGTRHSRWDILDASNGQSMAKFTGSISQVAMPQASSNPKDSFGKESLGPLGVVYYYFRKWKADGVMRSLTWKLNSLFREQKSKELTPSVLSIDSQSVKKAPFVQEQTGIDGNKKVNGRKRHILMPKASPRTDTLGLVWSEGLLWRGWQYMLPIYMTE